jgi:hypothetical protein
MIHSFGCLAYAHIPKENRKKFQPRARRCILLGIADNYQAFRLLSLEDNSIIISRDVTFKDDVFPKNNGHSIFETSGNPTTIQEATSVAKSEPNSIEDDVSTESESDEEAVIPLPNSSSTSGAHHQPMDPHTTSLDHTPLPIKSATRTSNRSNKGIPRQDPSFNYSMRIEDLEDEPLNQSTDAIDDDDEDCYDFLFYQTEREPKSYKQALQSRDREKWMKALKEEFDANIANNTWSYIDMCQIPRGTRLHHPIWRFKIKTDGRYKARLCFDGRHQQYLRDYFMTYAPTPRLENIRLLLIIVTSDACIIEQGDVPSAFLNSKIDADVYMKQPEGFSRGVNVACKLNKGLYGLKQASRLWYSDISNFTISEMSFIKSNFDDCIFYRRFDDHYAIIILYVDDILVASTSVSTVEDVMGRYVNRFKIKRMGPISDYLGITFKYYSKQKIITMNQSVTITKMLQHFDMTNIRPASTPYNPDMVMPPANGTDLKLAKKFRSAIGGLLWIARCSRPDIMFIVGNLSQFQIHPTETHMGAVKHIMRYLAATIEACMILKPDLNAKPIIMCDSSFADLSIGLYSTTGFIIFLFGAPFLWRSIKQKALAMSSTEAEYNAAAEAIKYISFFKRVLEELATALSKNFNLPFELQIDSQSCADDIRRGAPNQGRTRFMDLKTNKIIEKFQAGHFTYKWIAGSNNTADILTKRIRTVSLFVKHRDTLVSLLPSSAGECQDTDDVIPPRMQPLDAK